MDWIKKHMDTTIIISIFASGLIWMNGKFNDIDRNFHQVDTEILAIRNDMNQKFHEVNQRFSEVDKEVAVIKTIMIMKNIMPGELAQGID